MKHNGSRSGSVQEATAVRSSATEWRPPQFSVFDVEPAELEWAVGPTGTRPVICMYGPQTGRAGEMIYLGTHPPSEEEFQSIMAHAKGSSVPVEEAPPETVFLTLEWKATSGPERIRSGPLRPKPFAEYVGGELESFCRPPWRKGQGM